MKHIIPLTWSIESDQQILIHFSCYFACSLSLYSIRHLLKFLLYGTFEVILKEFVLL